MNLCARGREKALICGQVVGDHPLVDTVDNPHVLDVEFAQHLVACLFFLESTLAGLLNV